MTATSTDNGPSTANQFYPYIFVFLWSTGFIGAKYGLPHAAPLSFLTIRYFLVSLLMAGLAIAYRAPWPKGWRNWMHIGVTGLLMHAIYLGGVFIALAQGLPAAVCSLVVGLQPLLTAVTAGWFLGEKVLRRQWTGLFLGFVGTVLVLSDRLAGGFGLAGLSPALFALVAITAGTLYQKRYCPSFDWRTGAVVQFVPAAALTLIPAMLIEHLHVEFVPQMLFALTWLVLVLSVGAISLLNHLIRSGTAVSVVSLFYLVPACTAALAWFLFDEALSTTALFGMAVALWGVSLSRR